MPEGQCCSTVDFGTLDNTGAISLDALTAYQIDSDQEADDIVTAIEGTLVGGAVVWFGMYMPGQGWDAFRSYWINGDETALWNLEPHCGMAFNPADGAGGHALAIVGYHDDGTEEGSYGEVLNSWGTTDGRPNGTFRLKMGGVNYNCSYTSTVGSMNTLTFGIIGPPGLGDDPADDPPLNEDDPQDCVCFRVRNMSGCLQ